MAHVDLEILALLALERAGGRDEDRQHLMTCDVCRAELSRLADVVRLARSEDVSSLLEPPPPHLWARIAAELAIAELELQPGGAAAGAGPGPAADGGLAAADRTRPGRPLRRWYRPALIAAAGLIIGAGAATAVQQLGSGPGAPKVAVVGRAALRPLAQFPQWRGATGTAVMEQRPGSRLLAVTLRASAGNGYFEVWLLGQDGKKMVSLGDLNGAGRGVFTMPPGVDLGFYSRIDISLQPFNGSTVHSKVSVVRGSVPGS